MCLFFIWSILEARAEILTKKVHFWGDLKTPKFPSEINWPLTQKNLLNLRLKILVKFKIIKEKWGAMDLEINWLKKYRKKNVNLALKWFMLHNFICISNLVRFILCTWENCPLDLNVDYAPIKLHIMKVWNYKEVAQGVELVSKELHHLAAILHVYAGGLNFMK